MIPNLTATFLWTCHSQLSLKIKDLDQIPKTNNNKKEDMIPIYLWKAEFKLFSWYDRGTVWQRYEHNTFLQGYIQEPWY